MADEAGRRDLLVRHPRARRRARGRCRSAEGKSVLELSLAEAKRLGDARIATEHMLLALLNSEKQSAVELLEALEVHSPTFGVWETVGPDGHMRKLLVDAAELAVEGGRSTNEVADMVFAIAEDRHAMGLMAELGFDAERVRLEVIRVSTARRLLLAQARDQGPSASPRIAQSDVSAPPLCGGAVVTARSGLARYAGACGTLSPSPARAAP